MNEKVIQVTASAGPVIALCPHCKKIVGKTVAVMTMPFYEQLGDGIHREPEMLGIRFVPAEYCTCKQVSE